MLCNSRGMDYGYLFVHAKHPLALDLPIVMKEGEESKRQADKDVLSLDHQQGGYWKARVLSTPNFVDLIETPGEGFHIEDLAGNL